MLKPAVAAAIVMSFCAAPAFADDDRGPPENAKKLSEIVAKVEQRPDFRFIDEVEWDDDGYEVTYFTTDNAKVEIKFDPVSGETKAMQ